jgi:phosphate acetyltransferase
MDSADLEAGNMLAKQLTFMAGADAAAIVLGARVPIILTSRADNLRTRLASAAVAVLRAPKAPSPCSGHCSGDPVPGGHWGIPNIAHKEYQP